MVVDTKDNSKVAYKMVRVLNVSKMEINKKGTGRMVNSTAMACKIKLMAIDIRDNIKMIYKMDRVNNIIGMEINKKGTGRMVESMGVVY